MPRHYHHATPCYHIKSCKITSKGYSEKSIPKSLIGGKTGRVSLRGLYKISKLISKNKSLKSVVLFEEEGYLTSMLDVKPSQNNLFLQKKKKKLHC